MKTFVTFEKASLSRGYGEVTIWKSPLHLVMIAAAFLSVTLGQEDIISAGDRFTVVICRDGTARAAGDNSRGQLGAGSPDPYRFTPIQVIQSPGVPLSNIKAVSAGGRHALFLLEDGTVRAVGKNEYGQLGDATTTDRNIPVPVLDPNNAPLTNIVAVSAGGEHSLFLAADSTVWAVGDNYYGQLGDPATYGQNVRRVVKVKGPDGINPLRGVIAIAAGSRYSLFLTKDGRVWATGRNNEGQLGDGTTQSRSIVVPVVKADGSPFDSVIAIAAGHQHSLFLRQDGSVWAVGDNAAGQLGDGTLQRRLTPVRVKMNDGSFLTNVQAIAAGGEIGYISISGPVWGHSVFLRQDGTVWAVGSNHERELGVGATGNTIQLAQQVLKPDSTPLTNVVAIGASRRNSYFVTADGTVFASGDNSRGQQGNGTTSDTRFATPTNFCLARVSGASSLPFEKPSYRVNIFPNPTSGLFTVELGGYDESLEIRVLDLTGREIQHLRGEGPTFSVDLTGRPGVYVVEVRTRGAFLPPVKVVVTE
jgi:alpha-tubulin suppressor-like RCC1 family protein